MPKKLKGFSLEELAPLVQIALAGLLRHGYTAEANNRNLFSVVKEGTPALAYVRTRVLPVTETDSSVIKNAEDLMNDNEGTKLLFVFVAWTQKTSEIHLCLFDLNDIYSVGGDAENGPNLIVAELEEKIQSLRASGKFAVYERIPNVVSESDLQGVIDKAENSSPASSDSTAADAGVDDSGTPDKNGDTPASQTRDGIAGREACDLGEPPARVEYKNSRIIRDTKLSHEIKERNDYTCQICKVPLCIDESTGEKYAEAHHIQPLGEEGPDIPENMICVCPNCHALLDYRAIKLPDAADIGGGHEIEQEYINYHNREVDKS